VTLLLDIVRAVVFALLVLGAVLSAAFAVWAVTAAGIL
jgi:hypothetical protein